MDSITPRSDSVQDEKFGFDPTECMQVDLKALDVGLALIADETNETPLSPYEAKRLCRKIDWHLLPLLCLIYTGTLYSCCIIMHC